MNCPTLTKTDIGGIEAHIQFKINIAETPNKHSKKTLDVLSLFSGCGGMDLGFEGDFLVLKESVNTNACSWNVKKEGTKWLKLPKTAFNLVFANDIKPEARAAWVHYFQKKQVDINQYYLGSIVDLVNFYEQNKENHYKIFPNYADVVIGGFPCQDFSVAGKRLGFSSDKSHHGGKMNQEEPTIENRGRLYMWMRKVIAIVKPKVFVAENVKGLTNLRDAKAVIERDFSSVCNGGYLVVPAKVLNAANYGVPQGRERVIFFGFQKSALTPEALKALSQQEIDKRYDPYPPITHYARSRRFQIEAFCYGKGCFGRFA